MIPFKSRRIQEGQRVRVYRNLHNNLFSIMDEKTKHVIGHTNRIKLSDIDMKISKAGQGRARREKRRNVHAFICGIYEGTWSNHAKWTEVTYNPFLHDTFVNKQTEDPVTEGRYAYITNGRCYIEEKGEEA